MTKSTKHIMRTNKLFFTTFLLVLGSVVTLTSCSKDDDSDSFDGGTTSCIYCYWRDNLNSFCVINGVRYHTGTTSPQFLSTERGSYMTTELHKDNGTLVLTDLYNIEINLSKASGSSVNNLTVGQKLLLENGKDKVCAWYNEDVGKEVSYHNYISGSVTCTAKSGSMVTLTLNDLVLENAKNSSRVTINGSLEYNGANE